MDLIVSELISPLGNDRSTVYLVDLVARRLPEHVRRLPDASKLSLSILTTH